MALRHTAPLGAAYSAMVCQLLGWSGALDVRMERGAVEGA